MEIVDAQLHLNLLGIDAARAGMDAVGIDSVLVDEYWGSGRPGHLLRDGSFRRQFPTAELAVALHPDRFAHLVRYGPDDPDLPELIEELRRHPRRLALRITPSQLRPDAPDFDRNAEVAGRDFDAMEAGAYDRYFELAQRHEVPVFLQIAGVEVPPRIALAERILRMFPELLLIVDHCGVTLPADPAASYARTRAQIAEVAALARFPNAALKWGHAPELVPEPYPYAGLIELLHELLAAFGADRVLWASDWMPGLTPHSWAESLYYLRDSDQLSESEKAAVLGGTVRTLLRWPASG